MYNTELYMLILNILYILNSYPSAAISFLHKQSSGDAVRISYIHTHISLYLNVILESVKFSQTKRIKIVQIKIG